MRRFLAVLALTGCTFSTAGVPGDDVAPDADPTAPDAQPIVPDADPTIPDASCTPGCDGDTLISCTGAPDVECDLGCSESGAPHCRAMVPSNLTDTGALDDVNAGLTFVSGEKYDLFTDTGQITAQGSGLDLRAAGASVGGTTYEQIGDSLAVLAVDSLTVEEGAVVLGYGQRALIVLSRGAIAMHGEIDFSAGCVLGGGGFTARCGGPGAGNGGNSTIVNGEGCAGGTGGENGGNETGGAGGGFATSGGNGGPAAGKTTPLATPITTCAGPTLIPLRGGSGGGAGAPSGTSVGGGGGGALQLSSLASITIGSAIAVERPVFYLAGAGGTGTNSGNKGGGGGGSGGALLLEAPTITIVDVVVITSGGGGGGGRTTDQDGAWGPEDGTAALGGAGDPAGAGGNGGIVLVGAQAGGGNTDGTGGGGGGIGRLRINTEAGGFTVPGTSRVVAISSSGTLTAN